MNYLFNHTSFDTAYRVEDYPYGFKLRTTIYYWLETVAKKGDRFCSQTINPKNGKLNAPKKSTFCQLGVMYLDEKKHVHWSGVSIYTEREKLKAFVNAFGADNLNTEQRKIYNSLTGINTVEVDEFTGKAKKDFSIKWEKDSEGKCDELRITFDRPDGVKIKEIYKAMKSVNQDRLNEVFAIRNSKVFGDRAGVVRICTRGGAQLGTATEAGYKEYLASDYNQLEEENENN